MSNVHTIPTWCVWNITILTVPIRIYIVNIYIVNIEMMNSIKYLVLYIDFQLKLKIQIDYVVHLSRKLFYVEK